MDPAALHDSVPSLPDIASRRHLPARGRPKIISKERFHNWTLRYDNQALHGADPWPGQRPPLRPHQIAILAATHRATCNFSAAGVGKTSHRWTTEEIEGRDLARSKIRLPGDGSRQRPPSLERQEAFRDARTVRKRPRASDESDESDEAELYRLGLLYEDEHERGPGFGLNLVLHDEPLYTVSVRPAKRFRKFRARGSDVFKASLPLDLSLTTLRDDDAVAKYLTRPAADEIPTEADAPQETYSRARPLTIIYEVEASTHSLHSTLDANDFPDLISVDGDSNVGYGYWAILPDGDRDGVEEDEGDATSGIPDAWIMLR